jgi:hypothetical protein
LWEKKKVRIVSEYAITGSLTLNSQSIAEIAGSGVEDGSRTRRVGAAGGNSTCLLL